MRGMYPSLVVGYNIAHAEVIATEVHFKFDIHGCVHNFGGGGGKRTQAAVASANRPIDRVNCGRGTDDEGQSGERTTPNGGTAGWTPYSTISSLFQSTNAWNNISRYSVMFEIKE